MPFPSTEAQSGDTQEVTLQKILQVLNAMLIKLSEIDAKTP